MAATDAHPPVPDPPSDGAADTLVHRYRASVAWAGSTGVGYEHYDRTHVANTAPATTALTLSADPAFRGNPDRLDPEQLLVLSASSCQLLSFLAVAARARLDVVSYHDEAEGEMPEGDRPVRITRILLRPHVVLSAAESSRPAGTLEERVRRLLEVAHRECYIANTLNCDIEIDPTIELRIHDH